MHLHLVPRPQPALQFPTVIIHCHICRHPVAAITEGRAIRALGAHIIACHHVIPAPSARTGDPREAA